MPETMENINGLKRWVCRYFQGMVEQTSFATSAFSVETANRLLSAASLEDANFWQALPGDAGFRQYFRLSLSPSLLAVYSPPATEKNEVFSQMTTFFRENGVYAPKIVHQDFQQGYFLLEDLGESVYLSHLNDETVDGLYAEALMVLLQIQQSPVDTPLFPAYDRVALRAELDLFPEWFIEKQLGYSLSYDEKAMIENVFRKLEDSALEQPQVIVHRDFHSRNIIYRDSGRPGIIDFQDGVVGPLCYDLVSLLRDCYVQWPADKVKHWATAYANLAIDIGLCPTVTYGTFVRWFDWMGLQRHLKVLGIFCRLSIRDGRVRYLNDLPLVLHYVDEVLVQYPAFSEFYSWFQETLRPLIEKQHWMLAPTSKTDSIRSAS